MTDVEGRRAEECAAQAGYAPQHLRDAWMALFDRLLQMTPHARRHLMDHAWVSSTYGEPVWSWEYDRMHVQEEVARALAPVPFTGACFPARAPTPPPYVFVLGEVVQGYWDDGTVWYGEICGSELGGRWQVLLEGGTAPVWCDAACLHAVAPDVAAAYQAWQRGEEG